MAFRPHTAGAGTSAPPRRYWRATAQHGSCSDIPFQRKRTLPIGTVVAGYVLTEVAEPAPDTKARDRMVWDQLDHVRAARVAAKAAWAAADDNDFDDDTPAF